MSEARLLFHSEINDRSLSQQIGSIREEIRWIIEHNEVSYDAYYESAKAAMRTRRHHEVDFLVERFPQISDDDYRARRVADACLYLIGAEEGMLAGNIDSAWYRCVVASRELGKFEGRYRDPYSSEERVEFATLGGLSRGKKNHPVRAELVRLLVERRPSNGWATIRQAVDAVAKDLAAFNEKNGSFLKAQYLRQNIRRWIENPDQSEIRAAFDGRQA